MIIDLRSDTVTKPGAAMLAAMMNAEVGDDVFGEDPSVNRLQTMAADLFGMEAAIFCPSGTMTNQIAIRCHTQPGDEVICEKLSHVYIYEGGGIASNSGCQVQPIDGDLGRISAKQVEAGINPMFDYKANTSLVSLENTTNRGGGACYDFEVFKAIREVCLKHHLKLHLDGARIFNAIVARSETPKQYGQVFDSISVCLSKGLGTPAGSLLLGSGELIRKARRIRKVFGGGMRQAGFLAAAGIYALEHHIERLKDDHAHTMAVGKALAGKQFVKTILPAETNILIFEVGEKYTAQQLADRFAEHQILVFAISPTQIRMVFHLDITGMMVDKLLATIDSF